MGRQQPRGPDLSAEDMLSRSRGDEHQGAIRPRHTRIALRTIWQFHSDGQPWERLARRLRGHTHWFAHLRRKRGHM